MTDGRRQMDGLVVLLGKAYGAHGVGLVPLAAEGARAVYRVDRTAGPPWVLRVFEPARTRERVAGDAAVLSYLERHGVPAERLVPAADGAGTVLLDERCVLVTILVPGVRPDRSPATLRRLGEAVGRLHALPRAPVDDPLLTRAAGAEPGEDLAAARAWLDGVADRVPPALRAAHGRLRAAVAATRDGVGLPQGLTHNDRQLGNAHLTPAGEVVLFDWEGAGQGTLAAALGWLLFSCAVAAPGDPSRTADLGLVDPVVQGYCQHRVPTDREMQWLADGVRVRPLAIAARTLAKAVGVDRPPDAAWAWSDGYGEAEAVAHRARAVVGRYG